MEDAVNTTEPKAPSASAANAPRVLSSEFIGGALNVALLPQREEQEIGIIGRSNAGKSTLVNRLLSRKMLARASKTPGKTQEINLYLATLELPVEPNLEAQIESEAILSAITRQQILLADLPGFGYAKFSHAQRRATATAIERYLCDRQNLSMVILLNDSKRPPEDSELNVQQLCQEQGIPLIIVATKIDRLSQRELGQQRKELSQAYNLEPQDLVWMGEKTPIERLWQRVKLVLE